MALGKPVIATRAGGPVEIVTHATGCLATPGDPSDFAAKILSLLGTPVLRAKMGEAGLRRFEERFTTERMAREISSAYRKALGVCASC